MSKSRAALPRTDRVDVVFGHAGELLVDPLRRIRKRALEVWVVVAPQQAVGARDLTVLDRHRVPHEGRMGLTLEVVARRRLECRLPRLVHVVLAQLPEAAVAPVVVEELDRERQPPGVALRHDDVEVGVALEDTAEGEPAERLTHPDALVVPADEGQSLVWLQHRTEGGRLACPADVHRDRHLQRVGGFPQRLPLREVVRHVPERVG